MRCHLGLAGNIRALPVKQTRLWSRAVLFLLAVRDGRWEILQLAVFIKMANILRDVCLRLPNFIILN